MRRRLWAKKRRFRIALVMSALPRQRNQVGIWLLRPCVTMRLAKTKLLGFDSKPNALEAATIFFEIVVTSADTRGHRNAARMLYFFVRTACMCMHTDQGVRLPTS